MAETPGRVGSHKMGSGGPEPEPTVLGVTSQAPGGGDSVKREARGNGASSGSALAWVLGAYCSFPS